MDEKKQISFIPFHAINEFMRNDFRLNVIRTVLIALPELDRKQSMVIDSLTRKYVKVAGFRNSAKAPVMVKAVAMVKAFEKQPKLVAAIIDAWAETLPELRRSVFDLLVGRDWKILPLEADRTKLPGFLTRWPSEDDYEVLYAALTEAYPQINVSIDETSLMVVWIAGRLPIEKANLDDLENPEDPDKAEGNAEE